MKRKIFFVAFCALSVIFTYANNLQVLFDKAIENSDKTLSLEPKIYFIDKPLVLTSKHSGLSVSGVDGTVISGGKKISGWEKDGIFWKVKVDIDYVSSLFVNGKRANLAKTPNDGHIYFYRDSTCLPRYEYLFWNEDIKDILSLSAEELKNLEVRTFFQWLDNKAKIVGIKKHHIGNIHKITFDSQFSTHYCRYGKQGRAWFTNYKGALDAKGEYYFDANAKTLWYIPRDNEDMETAEVYIPNIDNLIIVKSDSLESKVKDITFKNIVFKHASQKPNGKNGTWNNAGQGACTASSSVYVENADGITFDSCGFENIDGYALHFAHGVRSSSLRNSVLKDLGAGGVQIGIPSKHKIKSPESVTGDVKVYNNIICKYGRVNRYGVGVIAYDVFDITINNNEIFDGYYSGISTGWTWGYGKTHTKNMKVNFNHIHHIGYGQMCDMGGIYTLGIQPNSEIRGNYIHDIACHEYGGWGIYNDEGSSFIETSMNYTRNTQSGGYNMHYGQNCKVFNNLITFCKDYQISLGRQTNSFTFENNVVCFESPQVLFDKGKLPNPDFVKFESNLYCNKAGDVLFDEITFEEWKHKWADKNSVVEDVNIEELEQGASIPRISFKGLDLKSVGVRAKMKPILSKTLKDYKYPAFFNYPKSNGRAMPLFDNFSTETLDKAPSFINVYGKSVKVVEDKEAPSGRAILVEKLSKKENPNMLYMYHSFNLGDNSKLADITVWANLTVDSSFFMEFRESSKHSGNRIIVSKSKLFGIQLPTDKWLRFNFKIPQPINNNPEGYDLKITDAKGELVMEKKVPFNQKEDSIIRNFYLIMTGEHSAKTKFAEICIK